MKYIFTYKYLEYITTEDNPFPLLVKFYSTLEFLNCLVLVSQIIKH